jgi:hypothetical protein
VIAEALRTKLESTAARCTILADLLAKVPELAWKDVTDETALELARLLIAAEKLDRAAGRLKDAGSALADQLSAPLFDGPAGGRKRAGRAPA